MKTQIKEGIKIYAVEDDRDWDPILVEAEVGEVIVKQFRLKEGCKLFGFSRLSIHDPRISIKPGRAIELYITRKRRQIADLVKKKKLRDKQLLKAKLLLLKV